MLRDTEELFVILAKTRYDAIISRSIIYKAQGLYMDYTRKEIVLDSTLFMAWRLLSTAGVQFSP